MAASVWDEGVGTPLPSLSGKVHADVCVVGLGGGGLAAGTELISHGASVVGVDAGTIGGGAAGQNAGFLLAGLADFFDQSVRRFGAELASAIYRHTINEIQEMAAHPRGGVRVTGSLRIAATAEELFECKAHYSALRAHGFSAEWKMGPEGTGVLIPSDGTYHPLRRLRLEAASVVGRAVRLFENTPVIAIGPGEVTCRSGSVHCHTVIAAVDGRLECLFPELKPRVRTARLQMLATAPARDVSFPCPVYRRRGYEYWQQLPTGEIALGGFRDLGGETEWTTDATPGGIVQDLLEQFLREHLKSSAPITRRWAACVAYTPNRLPILEQVRKRVYVAGAYSGTGNIMSRLCGRAAARMAGGKRSDWAELLEAARRNGSA